MFKKYGIEIFVTLGMTALLIGSFGSANLPVVTPTAKAEKRDYEPTEGDSSFLEASYRPPAASPQGGPGLHPPDVPPQGGSPGEVAWTCRIWADGRAVQEVRGKLKRSTLSAEQVKGLTGRLRRENALELGQKLPKDQTGGPRLGLHIGLRGGQVDLGLVLNDQARENSEARRFLRIWADIVTEVPSPNGEKPMRYLTP